MPDSQSSCATMDKSLTGPLNLGPGAIPKTRPFPTTFGHRATRTGDDAHRSVKIEGPVVDEVLDKMPPKSQKTPSGRHPPPSPSTSAKLGLTRSATPIPDPKDVRRANIRSMKLESQRIAGGSMDPSADGPLAGTGSQSGRAKGIWCENCNSRLVELKRQAVKLWMPYAVQRGPSPVKDAEFLRHIEDRLRLPERLTRHLEDDTCAACDTSVTRLRQEALAMVHSLERTQAELGPTLMAGGGGVGGGGGGRKNVVALPRTNSLYSSAHHRLVRQGLHSASPSSHRRNDSPHHRNDPPHHRNDSPHRRNDSPHPGNYAHHQRPTRNDRGECDRTERGVQEKLGYTRTPSPYPAKVHGHGSYRKSSHHQMLANGGMMAGRPVTNGNLLPEHAISGSSQVALTNGALRPTMLPLPGKNHPHVHPHPQGHMGHPLQNPGVYPPQGYMPHHPGAPGGTHGNMGQFASPVSNSSAGSNASVTASFFARAAQKLTISSRRKRSKSQIPPDPDPPPFPTNFCDVIRQNPPAAPPCLLRSAGRLQAPGSGKVKVMLRICPVDSNNTSSWLNLDSRKKQITVYDPLHSSGFTAPSRRTAVNAPKMFAFDAVFSQDDSLTEICSTSLVEIVQAVVNGADGCLFCYGHARLGKTYTMLGVDDSPQNLGVIPCAIAWLFRLIDDQKERTGARFSVRVSAVEVTGKQEKLKDLLADVASGMESGGTTAPGVYLREDPICGMQIENQSELRAPTAERATYYLDAAVAARTVPEVEEDARNSHLLFTISVYQYRVEKSTKGQNGVAGGRSRLHLIDLGSCSKRTDSSGGNALSLSALGNVILALLNGQRHIPHRDSKLTQLIKESFGNWSCRTCMIAHVSPAVHAYNETLQVIQLASRIHRMKRRKSKFSGTSSDDSSCDGQSGRFRTRCRSGVRMGTLREGAMCNGGFSQSDPDYSSSEMSCDTVIYVGANGRALSDQELTDNEGPPPMMPLIHQPRALEARGLAGEELASVGNKHLEEFAAAASRIPKPGAIRTVASANLSRLPPKSPLRTVPGSSSANGGVVQLPRKMKPSGIGKSKAEEESDSQKGAPGSEHWVDGPGAPSTDAWMYAPGAGPDGQYYPNIGVPPPAPVPGVSVQGGEHWVDGPTSQGGVKDGELWVDGPREFRVESRPELPSSRTSQKAHKLWSEMQKQQNELQKQLEQDSSSIPVAHSAKPTPERTPKSHRKEIPHHKSKIRHSDIPKLTSKTTPVEVVDQPTIDQVNAESTTSLSVNADSRPVSCHSEEVFTDSEVPSASTPLDQDSLGLLSAEEQNSVPHPVKTFVHDWVLKHTKSSDNTDEPESEATGAHRSRISTHSPSKANPRNSSPRQGQVSVDDMATLPQKSHSPDKYISSAQSSPRLRRLRKHGLPQQANPSDRIAAWVMSVQDPVSKGDSAEVMTTTVDVQNDSINLSTSSARAAGSESPECDQELPGSPPPDYDSCVEEGIVQRPEMVQVVIQEAGVERNEHSSTVDTRTESCRDNGRDGGGIVPHKCSGSDCDKCNVDCSSFSPDKESSSLDVSNLLMTNRESIYELQMDEQLETGDGTHKTSFGSDGLSGCSSGSYQNITESKIPTFYNSTPLGVYSEPDEGILVVEVTDPCQLSPNMGHGDNESGIASGSGGHLSPPSSSDDSDKSPCPKRLVRPSSLRKPDGASNPNLTQICEMDIIKEESLKSEKSFELNTTALCMTDIVRDPAADGQSPESDTTQTISSLSKTISKLPSKSSLPSPIKPATSIKPPLSKSSSKSSKSAEKPAVPPRGSRVVSPSSSASSSPTKSISSSPIKGIFSKKDRSSKLPKVGSSSSGSSSCLQEKGSSFSRSSSAKSSKSSSKLPTVAGSSKPRSLSSPTKSVTSSSSTKESKSSSRSSSKSPSPSKREKESRLPKFGPKVSEIGHRARHNDSDSGNDSGIVKNEKKFLSPYSKMTRPRLSMHSASSGHGSDNSSTFSNKVVVGASLPSSKPCSILEAKLNKTETSSGYESMVRDDSELTVSSSSNQDSTSESSSGGHSRVTKLIRKKDKTEVTRRSKSAPSRSTSVSPAPSRVQSPASTRKASISSSVAPPCKVWLDTRRCQADVTEPLEIKKYEGEDLEKMARRRREAEFRAVEKRRQRISELLFKQENMKLEMMEAKSMLMIDKSTWSFDLHVAEHMDRDDPGYLEALEKETRILEKRVEACKSRIMVVTCFDI